MSKIGWESQSQEEISAASSLSNTFVRSFQREVNTVIHGCICPLCNGTLQRSLRKRVSRYRSGDLALLATDESHTDSYALGTRCLHLAIPSDFGTQLTRDFAGRGRAPIDRAHPPLLRLLCIANSKTLIATPVS